MVRARLQYPWLRSSPPSRRLVGFDRWVLTCSADGTDPLGYCDFTLGSVGPEEDWHARFGPNTSKLRIAHDASRIDIA